MKDNSTGKTKGFYERGQAIFDRIPKMPEKEKYVTYGMRVREAVAIALEKASNPGAPSMENWYYLDESLALHQLGKFEGHAEAYAEMEKVSKKRAIGYLYVMPEDVVTEWRAKLDRWLGDDKYKDRYKKREDLGDL